MIDYFALALGHGLLAIALLRLVVKPGLEADPLIGSLSKDPKGGRKAARRARVSESGAPEDGGA
ncbi:hypothetical protein ACLBKU_16780 [Erythrobacter sp. NE805]|uniref:hypothetical protein n=1 Tax=Erythrobacter sp. NE805 TaxID=3389875 RepID=UPI00396AF214